MSQLKALEIEDIPVGKIKPSPYQPRLIFELEDLRGSIIKYGIQDPLKVRKVGDNYELIDGERRWRIAQQEGIETVPCLILEYSDEEADALAWRFNTERKQYSLEERAKHFGQHQKEGLSGAAIGNIHGYSRQQVNLLLSIFRLPEKYQNYLWTNEFASGKFEYMYNKGLMNGGERQVPDVTKIIDEAIERRLTQREFENVVDDYLSDIEKRNVEEARKVAVQLEASKRREQQTKEAIGKPEIKPPESPKELEVAAKALMSEAKRRKTPKQLHQENVEKAKNAFNRFSLDEAERLEIDVKSYNNQIAEIEGYLEEKPLDALSNIRSMTNELRSEIRAIKKSSETEERKRRETEFRKKIEKETKQEMTKEVRKELKAELMKDEEFTAQVAKDYQKKKVDELFTTVLGEDKKEFPKQLKVKRYHDAVVSTFYKVRGWGIPMILAMGKEQWDNTLPYIEGMSAWMNFLLTVKPELSEGEQPIEPKLTVQYEARKIIDADYQIISEEG